MEIRELKQSAKKSLKGSWGLAIGAFLIVGVISAVMNIPTSLMNPDSVGNSLWTLCISIFITPPLQAGFCWFYLEIYDRTNPEIGQIFSGFKKYGKVVGASFLVGLFIILWSLLLIVPGIIKAISYSQTLYIIKENPDLEILESIKESQKMMKGYKWKYFLTSLSFIGWVVVPAICIFLDSTFLFIGFVEGTGVLLTGIFLLLIGGISLLGVSIYFTPYYQTTMAGFYRNLAEQSNNEER